MIIVGNKRHDWIVSNDELIELFDVMVILEKFIFKAELSNPIIVYDSEVVVRYIVIFIVELNAIVDMFEVNTWEIIE